MSDAVVFGGTGFIGRELVRQLLERGHSVRVASRSARRPACADPRVTFVPASVADAGAVAKTVEGAAAVFHLATGGGQSWADFDRDFIHGTRIVGEACLAAKVKRLIYTSSTAALYLGSGRPVGESAGADPKLLTRGVYSRAKIGAERVLAGMIAQGLPAVILRPGVVVGRGGIVGHGGAGFWPNEQWCLGWGRGKTPLPFVLVEDVAQACVLAMETPGIDGMAFNLAGDVLPTAREYVELLAARSLRPIRFYSQSLLKIQAIEIGKWILKALARKPENPWPSYRDLKSRTLVSPLDCSAARQRLGWKPNASLEVFGREAIDANVRAVPAGDLRLAPAR